MLKYARTILISFAVGVVCGGVVVYVVRNSKPQTITIHDGKVEYIEKTIYKVTTNTGGCCDDFNNLLADYNFLNTAPPVFNSSDDKRIYFSIAKNKYSLAYAIQQKITWSVSPMIGYSVNYDSMLTPALCFGVYAKYDVWAISLLYTTRNINIIFSMSFDIK